MGQKRKQETEKNDETDQEEEKDEKEGNTPTYTGFSCAMRGKTINRSRRINEEEEEHNEKEKRYDKV